MEGKPTIFPYSVLKTATKNFDPNSKLGEGGFGSVFKVPALAVVCLSFNQFLILVRINPLDRT